MGDRTATVVVEARSLVREALVSLMENHSYHVVCSAASTADIDVGSFGEAQPKLFILGALPPDHIAEATSSIRRLWQDAKIIVLFDDASATDLQKLLSSQIDACIPLFASPRTLIGTLQLIVCEDLRVVILSDAITRRPHFNSQEEHADGPGAADASVSSAVPAVTYVRGSSTLDACDGTIRRTATHGLSEREEQILKALIRGQSNKMIARMCSVTEATVKVHMKSILRKIRVANRTQAAIWALKNSYFAEQSERRPSVSVEIKSRPMNGHVV
jgi:two-component system nitrate/nitrite response regulator NarL